MSMVIKDGKWLLSETATTKKYEKELDTTGKYIDRNIVIEIDDQAAVASTAITPTAGSASMGATGFTAATSGDYYVTLTTTAGSAAGTATVTTPGWIEEGAIGSGSSTSVPVNGSGSKLYVPTNTITGSVADLTAPSVKVNGTANGFTAVTSGTTSHYVEISGTPTNGSVKGKATAGSTTGIVAANATSTSAATTITPGVTGAGKVYIPDGDYSASISSHTITNPKVNPVIEGTVTGIGTPTKPSTGTDGTDYWTISSNATNATAGSAVATPLAKTTAGFVETDTAGKAGTADTKSISATVNTGEKRYIPKASLSTSGSATVSATVAPGAVTIGKGGDVSGKTKVDIAPVTATSSITKYYIPIKATAAANSTGTAITASSTSTSASVSSAGYAPSTLAASGSVTVSGTAKTSSKDSDNYYIPIPETTYANTATGSADSYADISSTAPVLVSGGYLYINEGYNPKQRISLARLVPDGSSVKGHADYIISGQSAYDDDGTLVAGSLTENSQSGALVSDSSTATGYSVYRVTTTAGHNRGVARTTDIPVYQGEWVIPSSMPEKGQIITMNLDGTDKQYLVLKTDGNVAEVLARASVNNSVVFNSSGNAYANGDLDTYLNTTYYNTLSASVKSAIVDKNLIQYQYTYNSGSYNASTHASYANYSTKSQKAAVGNRHIYALGIEDVEEYFNNAFSTSDIQEMFNTTSEFIWLSSANADTPYSAWSVRGDRGNLNYYRADNSLAARPAFHIDLSKVSWS